MANNIRRGQREPICSFSRDHHSEMWRANEYTAKLLHQVSSNSFDVHSIIMFHRLHIQKLVANLLRYDLVSYCTSLSAGAAPSK